MALTSPSQKFAFAVRDCETTCARFFIIKVPKPSSARKCGLDKLQIYKKKVCGLHVLLKSLLSYNFVQLNVAWLLRHTVTASRASLLKM